MGGGCKEAGLQLLWGLGAGEADEESQEAELIVLCKCSAGSSQPAPTAYLSKPLFWMELYLCLHACSKHLLPSVHVYSKGM